MKITDFEAAFDEKVLARGYAYYKEDAILSVEQSETNENEYYAEVEGSEIYNVCIEISKSGEIAFASCDCPYDHGSCKHIAAVLYHLRDLYKNSQARPKNTEKLSDLIGKCSRKQLEDIILEHAKKDKAFKDRIKMMLSQSSDINKYISGFKRIAHRFFSDDDTDLDELFSSADILISKAEQSSSQMSIVKACTSIISIFYTEYENSYIDIDEVWDFQSELEICEERINTAVKAVLESGSKEHTAEVWSMLINSWTGDNEYTGQDMLFSSLLQIAAIPEYRMELEEKLNSMKTDGSDYDDKGIDRKRYDILARYGTKDERERFISDHINEPYFRSIAIENAINAQDYTEAERLALDGEASDSEYSGLVHGWKKKRRDIYILSGDKQKLLDIDRQLILLGDDEYYNEWKSLIPEDELQVSITKLLSTPQNRSYEYIVVQENMSDRIFELCCKYADKITDHFKKLKGTEFEEKALSLYEKYLQRKIENAGTRSSYKLFCQLLKGYSHDCGKKKARSLADKLREEYCRRPAFLDELNKAGF